MEEHKMVLVIEDTLPLRDLLCVLLKARGFEVRGCEDGASALYIAAEENFHIVITDYEMPAMNGADVTKRLRGRLPESIIIGVSSDNRKQEFLGAGADAFLLKPFRYADLLAVIAGNPIRALE